MTGAKNIQTCLQLAIQERMKAATKRQLLGAEKMETSPLEEEFQSNNGFSDNDVDYDAKRGKTPDYDPRHLLKWIGLKKLKKHGVNDIS